MDSIKYDRVCIITSILFTMLALCHLMLAPRMEYCWLVVVISGVASVTMRSHRMNLLLRSGLYTGKTPFWYADVTLALLATTTFFCFHKTLSYRVVVAAVMLIMGLAFVTPGDLGRRLQTLGHLLVVVGFLFILVFRMQTRELNRSDVWAFMAIVAVVACALTGTLVGLMPYEIKLPVPHLIQR